ncbi:MAG: FAD-binding protein, partial [Myxococcales bacterium]|nr:FAD-binding protein [Myxococcales bacterium]
MTKPLSERIVEFYESVSTSNPDVLGKIDALYDEHVRFESPIEVRDGRQAFKDSWAHAFQAYDRFAFEDIVQVGQGDDLFALFYTMDLQMKGAPPTPTPTATVFWGKNGKVVKQIDYWDTVGSLAQVNPILDRAYRLAVAWLLAGGPPYDADPPPPIDAEGIYHPTSEEALRALVAETHAAHKQLRFAGSGHSVWEAIVPSHYRTGQDERRLALLDGYRRVLGFKPVGDGSGDVLVEVEAGISVGASPRLVEADPISVVARDDPKTPNITRYRTWEQSLCLALQNKGLALPDLGGISHQTAAGFISTGSAGGTCKWSVSDAVVGLRVVDGKGEVHPLSEDGDDPDWFRAAGLGMGLCGAISTVTFRCCPTFNITGVETTSTTSGAPDVDFYGPGDAKRPSLAKFLLETDYTRLMWWPQRDFDRLVVWKASRIAPTPNFEPKPYE